MKTVVHVAEAWGGGVESCVRAWARVTPEFKHVAFVGAREQANFSTSENLTVKAWQGNKFKIFLELKQLMKDKETAAIHLHSSYAGLLRVVFFKCNVIYSPHCYAFERKDIAKITALMYFRVEKLLSRFKASVLAVSPREAHLAESLGVKRIFQVDQLSIWERSNDYAKLHNKVVGVGRIAPQKNPRLFAQIAQHAKRDADIEIVWIGDGDADFKKELVASGVTVTGWLPPDEVFAEMESAKLLLHTALWEGAPVVFADAAALGLPIAALRAPYLSESKDIHLFDSCAEASSLINSFIGAQKSERYIKSSVVDLNTTLVQVYGENNAAPCL